MNSFHRVLLFALAAVIEVIMITAIQLSAFASSEIATLDSNSELQQKQNDTVLAALASQNERIQNVVVSAQNETATEKPGYLKYSNSTFGFSIEYPSDWSAPDGWKSVPAYGNLVLGLIELRPPTGVLSSDQNSSLWITTEYLPNRFMSLDEWVDFKLSPFKSSPYLIEEDFDIYRSPEPIILGDQETRLVEVKWPTSPDPYQHEARLYVKRGEIGYVIVYSAIPSRFFPVYLQDAERIIESFKFIPFKDGAST